VFRPLSSAKSRAGPLQHLFLTVFDFKGKNKSCKALRVLVPRSPSRFLRSSVGLHGSSFACAHHVPQAPHHGRSQPLPIIGSPAGGLGTCPSRFLRSTVNRKNRAGHHAALRLLRPPSLKLRRWNSPPGPRPRPPLADGSHFVPSAPGANRSSLTHCTLRPNACSRLFFPAFCRRTGTNNRQSDQEEKEG